MSTSISDYVELDKDECIASGREILYRMAHIQRDGQSSMGRDVEKALDAIRQGIKPVIAYRKYDSFELDGPRLLICESGSVICDIHCRAFELIEPETVKSVYAFVLTAGDTGIDSSDIMAQLFADYWGTAITEAARQKLIEIAEEEARTYPEEETGVSELFGPGLYGMPMEEMQKLPLLCDFTKAGVTVSSSCLMPEKSVAGLFFITDKDYKPLEDKCARCLGNVSSCSLCSIDRYK